MKKTNKNFSEDFILKYKAAIYAKLTKDQFSDILGIKPESLVRRRLAIFKERGLDLPYLASGTNEISQKQQDKYNEYIIKNSNVSKKMKVLN